MLKNTNDELTVVIFGASGDLAARKLVPALAALAEQGLMPAAYRVLGVGRAALDDAAFRAKLAVEAPGVSAEFLARFHFLSLDTSEPAAYDALRQRLADFNQVEPACGCNVLFYLAVPPTLFQPILAGIAAAGLNQPPCASTWRRIVFEKPFGHDLASARALNATVHRFFREEQVYRIDHYLGKETVQNMLVARFANTVFEPVWNRSHVSHVTITAAETLGVERRGSYYDAAGALRDMVQNHLLQLLAFTAMESPATRDARAIRGESLKVFQSLQPVDAAAMARAVVRGQYAAGDGMPGYREELGVPRDSATETFVALRAQVDNWRWAGVPFFIRTGKRLAARVTEVVLHFHPVPHALFGQSARLPDANRLVIRIQPDEGIQLRFGMKTPGAGFQVQPVDMDFHYADLGAVRLPDAYERLLLDCMNGDPSLFLHAEAVEATWGYIDPILAVWRERPEACPLHGYAAGSWGPTAAEALVPGGWRDPCRPGIGGGCAL